METIAGQQGRIILLIVDDDSDIRESLADMVAFKMPHIKVVTARSGEEAIGITRRLGGVDVILMDFRMPGIDGLDALEKIGKGCRRGAILITAYHKDAEAILAGRRGVIRRYMRKPVDPTRLLAMITDLVGPLTVGEEGPPAAITPGA